MVNFTICSDFIVDLDTDNIINYLILKYKIQDIKFSDNIIISNELKIKKISSLPKKVSRYELSQSLDNIEIGHGELEQITKLHYTKHMKEKITVFSSRLSKLSVHFLQIENYVMKLPESLNELHLLHTKIDKNKEYSKIMIGNNFNIKIKININNKDIAKKVIENYELYKNRIVYFCAGDGIVASFNKRSLCYEYEQEVNIKKYAECVHITNVNKLSTNDARIIKNAHNVIIQETSHIINRLFSGRLIRKQNLVISQMYKNNTLCNNFFQNIPNTIKKIQIRRILALYGLKAKKYNEYYDYIANNVDSLELINYISKTNTVNFPNKLLNLMIFSNSYKIPIHYCSKMDRLPKSLKFLSLKSLNIKIKTIPENTKIINFNLNKYFAQTKFPQNVTKMIINSCDNKNCEIKQSDHATERHKKYIIDDFDFVNKCNSGLLFVDEKIKIPYTEPKKSIILQVCDKKAKLRKHINKKKSMNINAIYGKLANIIHHD